MQVVLARLEWDCCFVYIDNILIASQSFKEHIMRHLQVELKRLRQAGLRLRVPYLFKSTLSGISAVLSQKQGDRK